MALLDFPNVRLPLHLEIAPGATWDSDPDTWPWADMMVPDHGRREPRMYEQVLAIQRGRAAEAGQSAPSNVTFELENDDGYLTPHNPSSPWWPVLSRGMGVRIWLEGPDVFLDTMGRRTEATIYGATTPDNAALDITSDIFLAADVMMHDDAFNEWVVGKWAATSNQRSYALRVDGPTHQLSITWSTDGTTTNQKTLSIEAPIGMRDRRLVFAAALDVNNGAGGHQAQFYLADYWGAPWVAYGAPVVGTGTTSIFNSTANAWVAAPTNSGSATQSQDGRIYHAEIRTGIVPTGGTVAANPDFTIQALKATGFTDAAGRVWTVGADAEITNREVRFLGTAAEVTPVWPSGGASDGTDNRVSITASSVRRRLNQTTTGVLSPIRRLYASARYRDRVHAYWPMEDEPDGTNDNWASPVPNVAMLKNASGWENASDGTLGGSLPLPHLAASAPGIFHGPVPAIDPVPSPMTWTAEWFYRMPTYSASLNEIMAVATGGTWKRISIQVSSTQFGLVWSNDVGFGADVGSGPPGWHTWTIGRLELAQNGTGIDYDLSVTEVDGGGFTISGTIPSSTLGHPTGVLAQVSMPNELSIGHISVHDGIPLGWLAGADRGWTREQAAVRIWRSIHDDEGAPLRLAASYLLSEKMGLQPITNVGQIVGEATDLDMGILTDARDVNGLWYRSRTSLYQQGALLLDASRAHIDDPFVPTDDDKDFVNDVEVTMKGGTFVRAVDEVSLDDEGSYPVNQTLNVADPDQLDDQASWRLHVGTHRGMRYRSLLIDLGKAPDLIRQVMRLDVGSRVQVINLPPQHPADAVDLLIQGYTEMLSPVSWTFQANCSPAEPYDVGIFEDDVFGRVSPDESHLAADVTDIATSFSVVTTGLAPWATTAVNPAEFPFDIEVDGERMTVTGITNAASPQTFTVTRSVNGVVKSHLANASVELYSPLVLAL